MLSILDLIPKPPGRIESGAALFNGDDLLKMDENEIRSVRGAQIGMIFQEPMTSLNPVLTIGKQIREPLELHLGQSRGQDEARAIELLEMVGILMQRHA